MRIPYRNSMKQYMIIEDNPAQKLNKIKDQYLQVHIGTLSKAKYF